MSKFDDSSWTTYTTADGLADNYISSIAIDGAGTKWFGTTGGTSMLKNAAAYKATELK